MKNVSGVAAVLLLFSLGFGQTTYKTPPREVVAILDAPPPPLVEMSPQQEALLLVDYRPHPALELLAQPVLKLAGVRLNPNLGNRQRLSQYTRLAVNWLQRGRTVVIDAPTDGRLGMPKWSYNGARLAFTHDLSDGVELWVAEAATGKARLLPGVRVSDMLTTPFRWTSDNEHLLVLLVPAERGAPPPAPLVPTGPIIEETAGKFAKVMTFQDLLRNEHDERLFEHFATTQLALVHAVSGEITAIGAPAMIMAVEFSPDEKFLLVTRVKRPFSYRVPYFRFTRVIEVWDRQGRVLATIADLPIADEIPTQGVAVGPREVGWQPRHPAKLLWVEALDGGDPLKKVPQRDKLMTLAAPFSAAPAEVMRIQHRFAGIDWLAKREEVLLTEYDRDRRWRTTAWVNLAKPAAHRKVIFDLSVNDAYGDPGQPVYETRTTGETVLLQDGDWIYLNARGASPEGARPRLDRLNLKTLARQTLFQTQPNSFEPFLSFVAGSRNLILTRYESPREPPNYFMVDLKKKTRTTLTDFRDPAPQLTGLRKELVKYHRPDGVPLSGTLYLPPGYESGSRLPVVIWAYPLEYSDAGTAGQVRGSPHTFTFLRGASPLFFLTQGYAVFMDATMPVVGDPETMNDTFVEQIVAAGRAAIDKLDSMGVIDRTRVCVAGHSYGAFMTANLLAHSDDFAAGIARSGAYNRSLTPFGFQNERRSFWEAPEIYMRVSPFTHAHKINEPLLLIHGEADNNPGTHTMQSERLFQAIKGNGGTARLVLLPLESHGYVARESVLHTLAEMFEWCEKHVKHRSAGPNRQAPPQ
ncbi:MAG: prolyl oligopeptidase family serine peptidase [candidate division KSB1 bacterium]|nr:prolyl oligopeptidase family serine peptidase [candidate division KSB1 bacterium]MDZ7275365.1 prolyl oligopeptidase family serine peptidase [candidate division KSB1 bacterium]MDZ7286322.1 prolyl oligopeptidase family serine peptidase [candidate division KSB1 bacterium]MDZ7296549.1 prolyl oligopeptidase family serine peptidase [candidate division KSB1 bacterium]MDZ7308112.1 prolyl oligopeptidase family serine peptidase [candidate division KSB1 bacterium]